MRRHGEKKEKARAGRKTRRQKAARLFHRYPAAPRRRGAAYFAVSFLLTVCLLAACAGVLVVDRNTRMVGWSENRVELAFSSTDKSLSVTLAGRQLTLRAQPLEQAGAVLRRVEAGAACVESPQARLAKMGFAAAEKPAAAFFGRLAACVAQDAGRLLGG